MLFHILLIFAFLLKVANSNGSSYINDTISRFTWELNNWMELPQEESEEFQNLIQHLALPKSLQRVDWRNFEGETQDVICIICRSTVNTFLNYRRQGMSEEDISRRAIKLCVLLNLEISSICESVININLPVILHIVDSKPNLTSSTICGVLLESKSCPLNDDEFNWSVNIDDSPPVLIEPKESNETLNIVQLTDIHYDPKYESYGNANCEEPVCCRRGQNKTNTSGKVAGFWGDYNYCDSPWHTVLDVLNQSRTQHQNISYVYFTGDIIDHGVWETTIQGNAKNLNKTYHQIHETFRGIPVYPILGNHEPHPVNQFAPTTVTNDKVNTQWLYKMIADLWINFGWLTESTRSTILQGGYYTISPKKGFRIIALNNNICYCYNWWIWYQPQDPDGQLQWLANTLSQAEKNGEFVHILGHVPPSTECQTTWRTEYIKIVNRYAHIIKAQFNGHTHNDELLLYYSNDNDDKIHNVAWNGGSATTYQNLNSNYKLYIVDSENYAVKNYENWMYNLTLANITPDRRPLWYKSYSFKEEYGLSNLSYDSLRSWLTKLMNDKTLQDRYWRNFYKHAEPSLSKECNDKCKKSYVCRIITSLGDQKTKCAN